MITHHRRSRVATLRLAAVGGVGAGLVLLVIGTFLPWLESGRVPRNSYAAGGALGSLLQPDGLAGFVLDVWPFVSAAAAVALALLVLGRIVLGAAVAVLAALAAGAVAVATLAAPGHGLIRAATSGPVVTLVGSAVAIMATAVTVIVLARSPGGFR